MLDEAVVAGGVATGILLTAVEADAGTSKSTGELRAVEVKGLTGGGIISLNELH